MKKRNDVLIQEVKKYLNDMPGLEFIYPHVLHSVLDILEKHNVHPAVWVAVGEAIAEEGVHRALDSLMLREEDLRPYVGNQLQSTANVVKMSKEI